MYINIDQILIRYNQRLFLEFIYVYFQIINLSSTDLYVYLTSTAWGYGLLAVTIINITSVLGFFFKPCMGTTEYKRIMMYMVSLAVGTLSGSAMVFLIPEVRGVVRRYD